MIRMKSAWAQVGTGVLLSIAGMGGGFAQQPTPTAVVSAPAKAVAVAEEPVYARVNGTSIMRADFLSALSNHLRQKLYHGQSTPERLDALRKEVTDTMVERILLLDEAKRRGLVADAEVIAKTIAEYDARYAGRPAWLQTRETALPALKQELSERNLLDQLEQVVRGNPEPSNEDVKKFYETRPELFTEPEKIRIHAILLKVDPSSAREVWDAAMEEAKGIVKRVRAGGSFEDEARVKSNDPSAEKGGDMGFLHKGMMPDALQARIKQSKPGEIPDPVEVLQGVGIFRLDELVPPQLRAYEDVKARAEGLLKRDIADKAWADLRAQLKQGAAIEVADFRFVTPPAAPGAVAPVAPAGGSASSAGVAKESPAPVK